MNKKLKVLTVVGTRPEIIRLARVIAAFDDSSAIEHILVHTGQNYDYELNQIFFEDLGIRKPDFFLNAAGVNAAETIGQILIKIDPLLAEVQPDAFLVLGDTNSCLCAIPAKKRQIPVFHMEAGNRCFDQRVPEETNRKIVDHVADINLTYSDIAREYLLREGLPPDRVIKTGSPMFEVLSHYKSNIENSDVLNTLQLEEHKYFVVSCHREENVTSQTKFVDFLKFLSTLSKKYQYPVIFSTHPRTRKVIDNLGIELDKGIQFLKPLGFSDYNRLQQKAYAVLSDSGTISEEASILNFPAINIREAHERPEAMEETVVTMTGLNPEIIMRAINDIEDNQSATRVFRTVGDYSMPNVSKKVVRIILSYTSYINRVVWGK
jgi:UDP-N-acetylglucosamine 2-epimerase